MGGNSRLVLTTWLLSHTAFSLSLFFNSFYFPSFLKRGLVLIGGGIAAPFSSKLIGCDELSFHVQKASVVLLCAVS